MHLSVDPRPCDQIATENCKLKPEKRMNIMACKNGNPCNDKRRHAVHPQCHNGYPHHHQHCAFHKHGAYRHKVETNTCHHNAPWQPTARLLLLGLCTLEPLQANLQHLTLQPTTTRPCHGLSTNFEEGFQWAMLMFLGGYHNLCCKFI